MTDQHIEELIRKYAERTANPEEVRQLMNWYRSAPVGEVPWPAAHPDEKQQVYHRMLQQLRQGIAPEKKVHRLSWLRVSALLVLVAGAASLVLLVSNPFAPSFITVANPSGNVQSVHLPDGSTVWLNAASTLHYTKAFQQSRELELEGEAYFDVTHDEKHPFSVRTGNLETIVLGTTFVIKAYPTDTVATVSVLSGRVKVANEEQELAVLTPAMQLQFSKPRQRFTTTHVDTASLVAWKKGLLLFDGWTLFEITQVLERWYGVQFVWADSSLKACRYYMSFDNTTSLEKLLPTMAEITGMQYRIDPNTKSIRLSGETCR